MDTTTSGYYLQKAYSLKEKQNTKLNQLSIPKRQVGPEALSHEAEEKNGECKSLLQPVLTLADKGYQIALYCYLAVPLVEGEVFAERNYTWLCRIPGSE